MEKGWHELVHLLVDIENKFEKVKGIVNKLVLEDEIRPVLPEENRPDKRDDKEGQHG